MKRQQYKAIAQTGSRYFGTALCLEYRLSRSLQLGIIVPKKYGKAIKRNLFKRRVREAFRLCQHELLPCEIVAMPRKNALSFSLEILIKDFLELHHAISQSPAKKSR